jgi:hypothetical protein
MSQRFFRSTDTVYEQVRLTLDQAWGHPKPGVQTCIEPAATAPHDSQDRVVLAVDQSFCELPVASDMLPQLLSSGSVEEIDEATYMAALPQRD